MSGNKSGGGGGLMKRIRSIFKRTGNKESGSKGGSMIDTSTTATAAGTNHNDESK